MGTMATARAVNSKLCDKLPNGEIFYSLAAARRISEARRDHFDTFRPHISPGYRSPSPQVILRRCREGGSPPPETSTLVPGSALHED